MSYTITVTYDESAAEAFDDRKAPEVCDIYVPDNCAADLDVFDGTYYDTNTKGNAFAGQVKNYFEASVPYPDLVAAINTAKVDGTASFVTEDPNVGLMVPGLNTNYGKLGFTFEVEDSTDNG